MTAKNKDKVKEADTVRSLVDLFGELRDSMIEERRIISTGTAELIDCAQRLINISKEHSKAGERSLAITKQITDKLTKEGKK